MSRFVRQRHFWAYYVRCYGGSYGLLLLGVLGISSQALLVLPIGLLIGNLFKYAIPGGDARTVVLTGIGVIGFYLLNALVSIGTRLLILRVTKRAIASMRNDLVAGIYRAPRSTYTQANLEQWHTTIVQDTERLDVMSNTLLGILLPAACVSLALSVVLALLNWLLLLLLCAALPPLIVVNRLFGPRVHTLARRFHSQFSDFSGGVLFALKLRDLVISQAAEEYEIERQARVVASLQQQSRTMAGLQAVQVTTHNFISTGFVIAALVAGGTMTANGLISTGTLISFYVIAALLNSSASQVLGAFPPLMAGEESLASLSQLLDRSEPLPYSGKKQCVFRGKIELRSVTFSYSERPLLEDVALVVQPGETVALLGPNGVGKSTLVNLILGFYRPASGQLFADDQAFDEIDLVNLRRQIGIVSQTAPVFAGTIAENIAYGDLHASPAEVRRAAELAAAADFIAALPEGYDTAVGDGGVLLSGGQRQRLALARALLRRPVLLILDEPTNHLDTAGVGQLLTNLRQLEPRPAMVIISHAAGIVSGCDSVYYLANRHLAGAPPASSRSRRLDDLFALNEI